MGRGKIRVVGRDFVGHLAEAGADEEGAVRVCCGRPEEDTTAAFPIFSATPQVESESRCLVQSQLCFNLIVHLLVWYQALPICIVAPSLKTAIHFVPTINAVNITISFHTYPPNSPLRCLCPQFVIFFSISSTILSQVTIAPFPTSPQAKLFAIGCKTSNQPLSPPQSFSNTFS